MLLNKGSRTNIITKDLKKWLGLPFPKLIPYMLQMVDQSLMKPMGIIRDFKIHVHGIPYIATFIVIRNNVQLFHVPKLNLDLGLPR
jgi:hypothetical protein